MSHQGHFPISNRDVICLTAASEAAIEPKGGSTHRIQDLLAKFAETLGVSASRLSSHEMASLIADGIPCELLQPGQDWQSGQLQMTVNFSFVPGAIALQSVETQPIAMPMVETPVAETPAAETPAAETPVAEKSAEIPMAAIVAPAALAALGLAVPAPEAEESFNMNDFQLDIDPMLDVSASKVPAEAQDEEAFSIDALDASLNGDSFDASRFDLDDDDFADNLVDTNDGMVAAALNDMGSLDDLDAGFGDMPSFRDTNDFGGIDLEADALSAHPELGMPAVSSLDLDFQAESALDQGFGSDKLEREGDRFTGDELDAALDLAMPTSDDAFSLEDAVDGFDFGAELDMIGEATIAAPMAFDEQPDFNLESELEASFGLGDDDLLGEAFLGDDDMLGDGLSEDLGDLAMDAAKLDVLSPTSPATQVPENKVARAIDTESLDELGFGMLDNPWDLSDDLDSMLLAQPPLG
jgi:hypothetical protein